MTEKLPPKIRGHSGTAKFRPPKFGGIVTAFWKFIKHKATDFDGVAPLKVDGKLVTDPRLKAEALNNQFQVGVLLKAVRSRQDAVRNRQESY